MPSFTAVNKFMRVLAVPAASSAALAVGKILGARDMGEEEWGMVSRYIVNCSLRGAV